MNKKFTSAVLAGAMAISALGVSAFAADETTQLTAAGEKTLKATAAFAPVAIDVTLPTSITAAINPYKIDYDFAGTKAGTSGVISPVYEIANNTADYGVKVAAKVWATPAKTVTVATVDKKTKAAPVFKNDNTEDKTVFAYLNTTVEADKSFANTSYNAADTTQVLFTEDEPDNAVMLMQIAKASGKGYFQIQGDCVEEPAEKWTKDDSVELSIVFDINPFNDSAEGGEGGGGGFTAAVAAADITVGGAGTLGALVANNVYAVTYDGGVGGNVTPTFAGYSVTNATCATAGCTVRASDARFSCTADGTYDVVITLENDSDSSDTPTITFRVTATDC